MHKQTTNSSSPSKQDNPIQNLVDQIDRLTQELRLKSELSKTQSENTIKHADSDNLQNSKIDLFKYTEIIQRQDLDIAYLKNHLIQLQQAYQSKNQENQILLQKIQAFQSENTQLQYFLQMKENQLQYLTTQIQQLQQQHQYSDQNDLKTKLQEKDKQIEELQSKISDDSKIIQLLKYNYQVEKEDFQKQLDDERHKSQQSVSQALNQTQSQQNFEMERQQLMKQLQEKQSELERHQVMLSKLVKDIDRINMQYGQILQNKQQKIDQLLSQLQQQQKQESLGQPAQTNFDARELNGVLLRHQSAVNFGQRLPSETTNQQPIRNLPRASQQELQQYGSLLKIFNGTNNVANQFNYMHHQISR